MNTPFKKRTSPITNVQPAPVQQQQTPVQETVVVEQPKVTPVQPVQQPVRKTVQQPTYYQPQNNLRDANREKYTATMEKELRIRVKIAAAKKGMQFSQYIEEAVLEKMGREGY